MELDLPAYERDVQAALRTADQLELSLEQALALLAEMTLAMRLDNVTSSPTAHQPPPGASKAYRDAFERYTTGRMTFEGKSHHYGPVRTGKDLEDYMPPAELTYEHFTGWDFGFTAGCPSSVPHYIHRSGSRIRVYFRGQLLLDMAAGMTDQEVNRYITQNRLGPWSSLPRRVGA